MQVVPVEEEPVTGVVVGVVTEQPGPSSGYVDQTLAMLDGLADEGGRGSLEFLGRWNDKRDDHAMPVKLIARNVRHTGPMVRVAFCKLVDELVQNNASSGTLAISNRKEVYRDSENGTHEYTAWEIFWSASPDDLSYQRHGAVKQAERLEAQLAAAEAKKSIAFAFADFKGVVDDFGGEDQIAVYRVTLPSRGLDPDKWVGRPPPPAPADLYTGPRSDGLLSTDEISGKYSAACSCTPAPTICPSMTVVPLGPDMIETFRSGCTTVIPILATCPLVEGGVQIRDPGTNKFRHWQGRRFAGDEEGVTFSANGMAKQGCCGLKKRPHSQKRAFQKVDAGDLAGTWCGCFCIPSMAPFFALSPIFLTKKRALNQDQYEESGLCCVLGLFPAPPLCLPPCPYRKRRTRKYVDGHPTNVFIPDAYGPNQLQNALEDIWYRDSGCAYGATQKYLVAGAPTLRCVTKC